MREPATRTAARSTRCCCARSTPISGRRRDGPPAGGAARRARGRGGATPAAAWRSSAPGPAGLECATALAGAQRGRRCSTRRAATRRRSSRSPPPRPTGPGGARCWTSTPHALDRAEDVERAPRDRRRAATTSTGFDEVVLAVGSDEVLPDAARHRARAVAASQAHRRGRGCARGSRRARRRRRRLRLVAVRERGGARRHARVARRSRSPRPAPAFGATLPPEGRVQLIGRLRGAPLEVRAFTGARRDRRRRRRAAQRAVRGDRGAGRRRVVVVGERVARDWSALVPAGPAVRVIGDALVPRKVAHAIAEGRAAARAIAGRFPAGRPSVEATA